MSINLEELVARVRLDTSGVAGALGNVEGALGRAGDTMTKTGKRATVGLTAPLLGAAIAGTKLAADFDYTMRQVGIATDGPTKKLSNLAKVMGAETAFSAKDAADAMLELAKGGMTAAQIEGGALEATMTAAAAGGVSLGEASTMVANAVATFGLKAKDAGQVAVALAGGANASSASMSSLQQGLQAVGGVASSAGLSLQETVGALSAFDAMGLKGSDAGTSLKAMLNNLIPTTKKASNAMRDLGLDFVKPNGEFDSMNVIARKLHGALGDASESTRSLALETIFGADGQRAANVLVEKGEGGLRKYIKATRDQKTTQELANAAMEGTSGAIERAQGSIETAALTLGEALAPSVEKLAGQVESAANWFSQLDEDTRNMIVQGGALVAAFGPVLIILGSTANAASRLIGVVGTLKVAMAGVDASTGTSSRGLSRFGGIAKGVAGAAGIGLLTSGLAEAKDEGATFGSVMQGVAGGAGIGAMFGPIGALVGGAAGGGLAALVGGFQQTADEAEAARVAMMKTEGFQAAKEDAATLTEALQGVVNVYGEVTRAAVESSFTGKSGQLDSDIKKLRDLGVSMDTIVSATLGRADAQKVVDAALAGGIASEQARADAAKAAYDDVKDGLRDVVTASGQVIKNGESLSSEEVEIYAKAWRDAKKPLNDVTAAQDTFNARIDRNTAAIQEHREKQRGLAADLGITFRQYKQMPEKVRTDIEARGLPETMKDSLTLIGRYDGLQNFKSIRAIVEAVGAPLTIKQVDTLREKYNLTPKQVKTLVQATGVEAESGKVSNYKARLDSIPASVTTNVHTAYTYSGLKDPTRGRDGKLGYNPRGGGGGGGGDAGDTVESVMADVTGTLQRTAPGAEQAGQDAGKRVVKGIADGVNLAKDEVLEGLENLGNRIRKVLDKKFDGKALDRHVKGVTKSLRDESKKVRETARAYDALVTKYQETEAAGTAAYDAIIDRLDTANEAVARAKEVVADFAASVKGKAVDFGSIIGLGERKNEAGDQVATTTATLLEDLRARAAQVGQWAATIRNLVASGLNQTSLQQLLAAGVEGGLATATAIQEGGAAAISEINVLTADIAAQGTALGDQTAQQFYGEGVRSAQAVADGIAAEAYQSQVATANMLAAIQVEIDTTGNRLNTQMLRLGNHAVEGLVDGLTKGDGAKRAARKLAREIKEEVKEALGIRSPSRVFREFGKQTAMGLVLGMDDQQRRVKAAANRMVGATQVPVPNVGAAMAGVNGGAALAVRVFIGERELTDIVRVEVGDTLAPVTTMTRQGVR